MEFDWVRVLFEWLYAVCCPQDPVELAGLSLVGACLLFAFASWLGEKVITEVADYWKLPAVVVAVWFVGPLGSVPEVVYAYLTAGSGNPELGIVGISGSSIVNATFIGAIAAFFAWKVLKFSNWKAVGFQLDAYMASTLMLIVLVRLNWLNWFTGGCMLFACMVYFFVTVGHGAEEEDEASEEAPKESQKLSTSIWYISWRLLQISLVAFAFYEGCLAMEREIPLLCEYFGISNEDGVGTLVALGTSGPDIALSVVFAVRGNLVVSFINAISSNVIDILLGVGIASVRSGHMDIPWEPCEPHMVWLACITLLVYLHVRWDMRLTKTGGAMFLIAAIAFFAYCFQWI